MNSSDEETPVNLAQTVELVATVDTSPPGTFVVTKEIITSVIVIEKEGMSLKGKGSSEPVLDIEMLYNDQPKVEVMTNDMKTYYATRRAIEETMMSVVEEKARVPEFRSPTRDPRLIFKGRAEKLYASKTIHPPVKEIQEEEQQENGPRKRRVSRKSTGADNMPPRPIAARTLPPIMIHGELTSKFTADELDNMPTAQAYTPQDAVSKSEAKAKQPMKRKPIGTKKVILPKNVTEKKSITNEVWMGVPDDPLEGGWPEGWIKRKFERKGGLSKGGLDRYWYSPQTKKKFRSMVEIKKFMFSLTQTNGDEEKAWLLFKGMK